MSVQIISLDTGQPARDPQALEIFQGQWSVYQRLIENDYLSHSLSGGFEKELFDKNTTIGIGYGLGLNTVGRRDDMNFSRSLTNNTVSLSLRSTSGICVVVASTT